MNHDRTSPDDPDPPPTAHAVEVSDTQSHLKVDPEALRRLVRSTLLGEDVREAEISLALVDDANIRVINRDHLGHDWATDVISFVLSEPGDDMLAGELIVSTETAVRTSLVGGVRPEDELALYIVHGLLHLCGYDDTEPDALRAMRRREGEALATAGVSNPFPAVATEALPWAS